MNLVTLLGFFQYSPILVSFFGALIGSDVVIITLAILAGSSVIPLRIVFVFCWLGLIVSESFWFYLGKNQTLTGRYSTKRFNKYSIKLESYIQRLSRGKPFLILFYSKFVFGTRFLTVFYVSKKISFKKFLLYEIFLEAMLVSILVGIGYSAGKGITKFVHLFKEIKLIIFSIVILLLLFFIVRILIDIIIIKASKR